MTTTPQPLPNVIALTLAITDDHIDAALDDVRHGVANTRCCPTVKALEHAFPGCTANTGRNQSHVNGPLDACCFFHTRPLINQTRDFDLSSTFAPGDYVLHAPHAFDTNPTDQ